MRKLLHIIFILLTPNYAFSQKVKWNSQQSIGLLIDYPITSEKLPESTARVYRPILFQVNLRFPLLKKYERNQLTFQLQPQFNYVMKVEGLDLFFFEYGLNCGLAYEYYFHRNAIFYTGIGTGPHYVNIETSYQKNGYIFSNNGFVGLHQLLGKSKWMMNYEVRFRHISNAGLQIPNSGIDNFFVGVGLSKFINSYK
ncbi:MAG TPA: acyloxyacyl hydrolase [Flavipsychrobacter sp.]|nr:acyloxyacyl hydrolase [Flavipsychrobacter sp.]